MKRETLQRFSLAKQGVHGLEIRLADAIDALATDAEVKRLRADRRKIDALWANMWRGRFSDTADEVTFPTSRARALHEFLAAVALKPRRKRRG